MNTEALKNRTKPFAIRVIKLVRALSHSLEDKNIGNQLFRTSAVVVAHYRKS